MDFNFVKPLADSTGLSEPALRLLVGILAAYPFALAYKIYQSKALKNLFCALSGLWLAWFCYGFEKGGLLHSFFSILLTYFTLWASPNRKLALYATFIGNFTHLIYSYIRFSTDNYDIDFTTAQCVLTLRLVGLAWDYFDGGRPENELEPDQKLNRLEKLPSILTVFGYCYFFGGFLVGPQFPMRHYLRFINNELFTKPTGKPPAGQFSPPSPVAPALQKFLLGVVYLAVHSIGAAYYPSSYMTSNEFLNEISLFHRYVAIWFCCKFALTKYLGIWLLCEGACILSGIGFNGYSDKGEPQWNAVSNVKPYKFETTLSLAGIVDSFNINTNDWVKRYVFKRLKFLGNKNLSQISALLFLALWHGLYVGYYLCFMLEFLMLESERKLAKWSDPLWKSISRTPILVAGLSLVCWLARTTALHYGLVGFEVKLLTNYVSTFNALFWLIHIFCIVVYFTPEGKRPEVAQASQARPKEL